MDWWKGQRIVLPIMSNENALQCSIHLAWPEDLDEQLAKTYWELRVGWLAVVISIFPTVNKEETMKMLKEQDDEILGASPPPSHPTLRTHTHCSRLDAVSIHLFNDRFTVYCYEYTFDRLSCHYSHVLGTYHIFCRHRQTLKSAVMLLMQQTDVCF